MENLITIITYAVITVLPFWACWKIFDWCLGVVKEGAENRKVRKLKELLAKIDEEEIEQEAHILRIDDYQDNREVKNHFRSS